MEVVGGGSNISPVSASADKETKSKVLEVTTEEVTTEEVTTEEVITEEVTTEPVTTEEVTTEEVTTEPVTNQQIVHTEINSNSNSVPTVNTHTHTWKEHTATTQVWIPNMVTVDDYEEQVKEIVYEVCDCGATFYGDDSGTRCAEHQEASMLEAARNGTLDECRCGGSMIYHDYVTETVKVGSHTEDHGHYENSTYVDYYYCDCGATK